MRPALVPILFRRQFDPLSLFAEGTAGFLFDRLAPQYGLVFQDSVGGTPAAVDGEPIGALDDRSPSNNDATQGTAGSKPTLKFIDSRWRQRYDGGDKLTITNNLEAYLAGADARFSIFMCVDGISAASTYLLFSKWKIASQRNWDLASVSGKLTFAQFIASNPVNVYRQRTANAAFGAGRHIVGATFDGTLDTNDGFDRISLYADGVALAATNSASGALGDMGSYNAALISGNSEDNALPLVGDIGPHLLIARVLTSAEIANLCKAWNWWL